MLFRFLLVLASFSFTIGHAAAESGLFSMDGKESKHEESAPLCSSWMRDVDEAFSLAQEQQKTLIVAFIGEPWCPWAEKMKKDVLNSREFLENLEDSTLFLAVGLDEHDSERNQKLREMFAIDQSPTFVIFDYSHEEIVRFGFLPLSAKKYARHVLDSVLHFEEMIAFLKQPNPSFSEEQIQQLYLNAKNLSSSNYREKILQIGLKKEKGSFFILEKYANQLEKLKFKHPLVQKTRKELLERDPDNRFETQLKMAILDFQKLARRAKGKNRMRKAISPLLDYVQKFGKADADNVWKVQMMIAQFLFSKKESQEAIAHAQASLEAAPVAFKPEVQDVIDYLQSSIIK